MSTTMILTSPHGQICEIRHVDPAFWAHDGPIEVGQYISDQNKWLSDRNNQGELIYHYTNLGSLAGIVREGAIWASDVRIMNDRAEVTYALDQMRARIAANEANPISDEVLNAIFSPGRLWQFAACFSRSRDQLSQWRAYGAKIAISIGFDRNHLTRAVAELHGRAVDCRYFGTNDFSHVQEELDAIIAALNAPGALNPEGKLTNMTLQTTLTKRAVDLASSIKHKSFAEEQEVRLIVPVDRLSERVEFRSSVQSLTPFAKIDIDSRRKGKPNRERFANYLGMMEVLVWPNDADNQVLDAIDMLLSQVGGVLIKRSESPYRT